MIPPGFSTDELLRANGHAWSERRSARFQDVDAAGIVFFPRLFEYFHDAYMAFLDASGERLATVLAEKRWAAPLRAADAEFLRPVRFGDELIVSLVAAHLEGSELTVGYRITSVATGKPVAVGRTRHVFVDGTSWQRTAPPETLRAAFGRLSGGEGA